VENTILAKSFQNTEQVLNFILILQETQPSALTKYTPLPPTEATKEWAISLQLQFNRPSRNSSSMDVGSQIEFPGKDLYQLFQSAVDHTN
jgi:hypothetical protein